MIPNLKLNPSNPRTISKVKYEKLLKSLETFTKMLELRPIIYDENGIILGGNMRYQALTQLASDKKIELKDSYFKQVIGYTEAEKKEFVIRDNVELGDWDMDLLANEWSDLPLDDWGIDLQGWGAEVEEDDAPEVSKEEPVSKLGEVYQLGRHRLMCGDSIKIEDVERLMNGQKADMVFTDPPYGVDYEGVNNDDLKGEKLREFIYTALVNMYLVSRGGSNIYLWHPDIHSYEFIGAFRDAGFIQARPSTIQWIKDSLVLSQGDYHSRSEPCLYGWKVGENRTRVSDRKQDNVWEIDRPKKSDGHPTMKPIELCAKAIKNSSKKDDIVLDLFGGSGSTLIACEQLNRTCYMMELDPKYCDVIRKRYAKFIGQEDSWQEI